MGNRIEAHSWPPCLWQSQLAGRVSSTSGGSQPYKGSVTSDASPECLRVGAELLHPPPPPLILHHCTPPSRLPPSPARRQGAGKTSIMRAIAGLWRVGAGSVQLHVAEPDVMFLPQRPYMVLGSLRDQVLYPRLARPGASMATVSSSDEEFNGSSTTTTSGDANSAHTNAAGPADGNGVVSPQGGHSLVQVPSDSAIVEVLKKVRLGAVLERHCAPGSGLASGLDAVADWSTSLSLGEQQRVAWARLLLASPRLALLDEATSALDGATEETLYRELEASGITYISIGHRSSLQEHHRQLLVIKPQAPGAAGAAPAGAAAAAPSASWELTSAAVRR